MKTVVWLRSLCFLIDSISLFKLVNLSNDNIPTPMPLLIGYLYKRNVTLL